MLSFTLTISIRENSKRLRMSSECLLAYLDIAGLIHNSPWNSVKSVSHSLVPPQHNHKHLYKQSTLPTSRLSRPKRTPKLQLAKTKIKMAWYCCIAVCRGKHAKAAAANLCSCTRSLLTMRRNHRNPANLAARRSSSSGCNYMSSNSCLIGSIE